MAHDLSKLYLKRHSSSDRKGVEKLEFLFRRDPTSRALAIAVKCCQCKLNESSIRSCKDSKCALHALRPFQQDVECKSAPHSELVLSDEERAAVRRSEDD